MGSLQSGVYLPAQVGGFRLLTVAFDINTHNHKLAARKIIATLYCWRVRAHMCNSLNSLDNRYRASHQNFCQYYIHAVLGVVPSSQAPLMS